MARERFADYNTIGVFADMESARTAVLALERAGIDEHDISLLGRGAAEAKDDTNVQEQDGNVTKDVAKTAAAGTAAGGGLGALAGFVGGALAWGIPGIGPVVGSAVWAATLGGAGVGAAIGGLTAGTAVLGQTDTWADTYQESLSANRVLVGVHADTPDALEKAETLLRQQNPIKTMRVDANGRPVDGQPLKSVEQVTGSGQRATGSGERA